MNATLQQYMTPVVQTIGAQASLADARKRMNEHAIRHLPVLEGGELVGMVSQRDIQLLESLKDVDPREVTVEEAMSQDVFVVEPTEPLEAVVAKMAEHKWGSALVVRGGKVAGIFTTVDALKALAALLAERKTPPPRGAKRRVSAPASRRVQPRR